MRNSADAQKRVILLMATLTLLVMPLVGWVISLFSNEVLLWDRWVGDESIWTQVFFGVAAGVT
ncbi:MAG: putative Mn2+ efflux pump MntP, partial [Flavobacteriales bacterium]